jgi:hypothetical protein
MREAHLPGVRSDTSTPILSMFTRIFHPATFLQSVYGTDPFVDYCRARFLPFEQGSSPLREEDARRWAATLAQLSHDEHAQVELELSTVNEMSGPEENRHLIEAAGEGQMPPDSVPSGEPLALWFLVNHPALFHEVFLQHEIREISSWRTAAAPPGLELRDLEASALALDATLRAFFRIEGTGRFSITQAHRLQNAVCFTSQVADRLQFLDVFSEDGRVAKRTIRRALPVILVYYPADGTVLLKSHLRSRDRIAELLQRFGESVLHSAVSCDGNTFNLELLKRPFHPLPDGEDIEVVRVKTLHLRYPEHAGRRQLKLETAASDAPDAIDHLLRSHVSDHALAQLRVSHAELQLRLRLSNGRKNVGIRLWPTHSNLSQTALAERLRVCLERWGLTYGNRS